MFCTQLGFQVNDLIWSYCEDVELAGGVEEPATEMSPEKFSEAQRCLIGRRTLHRL
jgi:hypothetical protein